jgi:uncharacterized protein YbjQ (UPF0145 family)
MTRMTFTAPDALRGAIVAAALVAAYGAQARNVGLKIPAAGPVAAARAAGNVADIEFAFGSASARGADIVGGTTSVQGVASPLAEAHGFKPTDAEACANAVRDALERLATAARAAGGHAVVGIVSTYNGNTVDDPTQVECRLGAAKVLAPLSGVIAKGLPPAAP